MNRKTPAGLFGVDNTNKAIQGRPKVCVCRGREGRCSTRGQSKGSPGSREDHCYPFHNSTLDPANLDGDGPEEACISSTFGQGWALSFKF